MIIFGCSRVRPLVIIDIIVTIVAIVRLVRIGGNALVTLRDVVIV